MKKGLLKKICVSSMVAIISLGIMGCGQTNKALENIKKNKKIIVGMSPDYPPFEFKDKQGNIVGMDIEIIKEIAKDLGVEYEIKEMDFGGLIPALSANKLDVVLSGMNPNPEREKSVTFSDGYYDSKSQFVVNKGDADKYKSLKDFEGKKISVQQGTVQEGQVGDISGAEIKALGKTTDCILTLQGKKVDAVLLDKPVALANVHANSKLELVNVEIVDKEQKPFAVAMKKGETDLQAEINKTISRLKSEGKLEEFFNDAVKQAE